MTCVFISDFSMVTPYKYHLQLTLAFDFHSIFLTPRRGYTKGDYLLLYNTLYTCDRACVLNENAPNSAVYHLTTCVSEAVNEDLP
jgi:hypothetical protein